MGGTAGVRIPNILPREKSSCALATLDSQTLFVVQSLSRCTLWTAACQDSLSFTISWSLLKVVSIESVMSSNHLILCCPLLLLPPVFPIIRVFFSELVLGIRSTDPLGWSILDPNDQPPGFMGAVQEVGTKVGALCRGGVGWGSGKASQGIYFQARGQGRVTFGWVRSDEGSVPAEGTARAEA